MTLIHTLKFTKNQILKIKVEFNFKTEHFVREKEGEGYLKNKSKKGIMWYIDI